MGEQETARQRTKERIDGLREGRREREPEPVGTEDKDVHGGFESGALSSSRKPSYHLVPFGLFLDRLAARYQHGADKYGEGNWARGLGDREYVLDRANHTVQHLLYAVDGIRRGVIPEDDDLAAVIWGAIFLMGAQDALKLKPE